MAVVYLVDAVRTPIGRYAGALAEVRPDDLAAVAIAALVARTKVDPQVIDDVILGCANQAGEDNRNVARMSALLAGLPVDVPGATVNRLCGSGLQAVVDGARAIANERGRLHRCRRCGIDVPGAAGDAQGARGFPPRRRHGPRHHPGLALHQPPDADVVGHRPAGRDRREGGRALPGHPPGPGRLRPRQPAEMGGRARRGASSRRRSCRWRSRQKKGPPWKLEVDEHPRPETTAADLAKLKPVFRPEGTVTAGNASGINDGAAALLLASESGLKRLGSPTPLARYVGAAAAGVEPSYMGIGPVPATQKLLGRVDVRAGELDLIELNEAFAAQALPCIAELGLDPDRVNVNGGAIALGHPLGCSGARLLVTLAHELARRGGRRGLATMCIGVGQGISALIER